MQPQQGAVKVVTANLVIRDSDDMERVVSVTSERK
jgi:hypothetical protein